MSTADPGHLCRKCLNLSEIGPAEPPSRSRNFSFIKPFAEVLFGPQTVGKMVPH